MDISEKHLILQQHLSEIVGAVPVGIAVIGPSGKIVLCNKEAKRIFGQDLLNLSVSELIPYAHRQQHPAHMARFRAAGVSRHMGQDEDIFGLRADGVEIPIDVGLTSLVIEDKQYVFASIVDISSQKLVEHALELSNQELSQFAYITSHDLKGPLTTIRGLTKFIVQDMATDRQDEVLENINKIQLMTAKLEKLVNDILARTQAEQQQLPLAEIDLLSIIDDVTGNLQGLAWAENISINKSIDVQPFQGYETRLYEILENIVSNSYKYCDPDKAHKNVTITAHDEPGAVIVTIEDNGLGIPEDNHEEVFTMFKRFHPERAQGSGLGMALVKKHLDKMGGEITFTSAESGTCFTLRIPRLNTSI